MHIIINGKQAEFTFGRGRKACLDYSSIARMVNQGDSPTITYRSKDGKSGSLRIGTTLSISEGMVINVVDTHQA